MSKLLIYKASAGSGKTFTLASDYITRLIVSPRAYRRTLAVTFTNKATAEMKERILQQLYGIWQGDPASNAYLTQIKRGLPTYFLRQGGGVDDAQLTALIRRKAGLALHYLLHDYSRFQVKTIDSFFQSVMQNVARELKLSPNFQVELDNDQVLSDSVDSLIDQLTPASPALTQLMEYISEQIENDRRWNVTADVKTFSKNITREDYMEQGDDLREQLQDPSYIRAYRDLLRGMETDAINELVAFHTQFEEILISAGIGVGFLKGGTRGIAGYFIKLGRGEFRDSKVINQTVNDCLMSEASWLSVKTTKERPDIVLLVADKLLPLLHEAEETRRRVQRTIYSCRLSTQHLNKLRLLGYVDEKMRALNHYQNRFLLSDTNDLLRRLVKSGDSSFVFEKAGMEIDDVMIDEFQDTSRMQWNNFQTLLLESMAKGGQSMIVGDIKQSIYRWRNGDWSIMDQLIRKADMPGSAITVRTLDTNYRSQAHVVDFNNRLFPLIVDKLMAVGGGEPTTDGGHDMPSTPSTPSDNPSTPSVDSSSASADLLASLRNAYSDVNQKVGKSDVKGYVKATIIESPNAEDFSQKVMERLGDEILRLVEAGVKPGDMAILFRQNKHIAPVADYIDRELRLPVVSDEAFLLDASPAVCLLVDALRFLADEGESIALASVASTLWLLTHPKQAEEDDHGEGIVIPWDAIFAHPVDYLPVAFTEQADRLRLMPLYNLVEELSSLFGLNSLPGQEAYLLAFFDVVGDYLTKKPSDISAFVQQWDEVLHKHPIAGGEAEGIRLLSIHKSKGLEFHTVFLPFCDWDFEPRRGQLLWCHPEEKPYDKVSLVPVSYGESMAYSVYASYYHNERLQSWVDNLNLLYVALTRASHNLLIWGYKKVADPKDNPGDGQGTTAVKKSGSGSKGGEKPDLTAGALVAEVIPFLRQDEGEWNEKEKAYECGTPCPSEEKKEEKAQEVNRLSQKPLGLHIGIESTKRKVEFRQSNRSARFIAGEEEPTGRTRMMARGSLLHALFAEIATQADVEPAIARLVSEGIIVRPEEVEEIHDIVRRALALPQVEDWYSGKWTLHREQNIIWMEDGQVQTRRPDRVMTRGNETVVVDFKFGRPRDQYAQQVEEYLRLLVNMGREVEHIHGYLWYVELGRIDEVNLSN